MKTSIILKTCAVAGILGISISTTWARGGGHRHLDSDGDGLVSQTEFLDGAQQRFERRDIDGDGVITLEDVLGHAGTHFTEKDTNQDGVLSPEEMRHRRRR